MIKLRKLIFNFVTNNNINKNMSKNGKFNYDKDNWDYFKIYKRK